VGPGIIERLQEGETASGALEMALEDGDGDAAYMQIGVVDGSGGVAVHTGRLCIAEAGHVSGDGFSVQANMMAKPTVWPAMADAYQSGSGDLADRLLRALQAAEAEGGDIRGRQSAAIVVEPVDGKGDRFDLRVEDSPDPLDELSRLIELQRAYIELNRGDARIAEGDITSALEAYRKATELVPDEATGGEAAFWVGVALAGEGRVQEARSYLARAIDINPTWVELLPRLVASKLLPDDEDLLHALRGV
jgi:uncharacterized Ntn-hydrolase superfamily protein